MRLRNIAWAAAAAVAVLALAAPPAEAHAVSGAGATNYLTRLKSVTPRLQGVRVRVVETGSRLELENKTSQEVLVLGYQDEPYLRIGPRGVFQNQRSPATYLNADRKGTTPVPSSADPKKAPQWRKTSGDAIARWHDHRIHWMATSDPPAVQRDRGRTHVVIPAWEVPIRLGSTAAVVKGDLVWIPGPSALPWLALAAGFFVVAIALGIPTWWPRPLGALVAVLIAVDLVHGVGVGKARAGGFGAQLAGFFANSYGSVFGWIAGAIAVRALLRRNPDGAFGALLAGGLITLFGALPDLADFTKSQAPFAWSTNLLRFLVAATLGLGVGVVANSVLGLRRTPPREDDVESAP